MSRTDFAALMDGHDEASRAFVDAVTQDLVSYLTQAERRQATILAVRP